MRHTMFAPTCNFTPTPLIVRAVHFAAQHHVGQFRKSNPAVPYINHPIDVMHRLLMAGETSPQLLAAAVLHDTVEDTAATLDDILAEFGPDVARYVQDVTDDKAAPPKQRKLDQIAHVHVRTVAGNKIKLADKLSNLSDLARVQPEGRMSPAGAPKGWTPERVQGYWVWAWFCVKDILHLNTDLGVQLSELFKAHLPPEGEREGVLEAYLNSLDK